MPDFVGRWDLKSTEIPGQILGARGVTFRFYASGRVDLIFADGFVGPVAMIEVARSMGHSGVSSSSWTMMGPSALKFGEFSRAPITMHERDGRHAFPQVGLGVSEWVSAMSGTVWHFTRQGDQLRLQGDLMGMQVSLRLMPEAS